MSDKVTIAEVDPDAPDHNLALENARKTIAGQGHTSFSYLKVIRQLQDHHKPAAKTIAEDFAAVAERISVRELTAPYLHHRQSGGANLMYQAPKFIGLELKYAESIGNNYPEDRKTELSRIHSMPPNIQATILKNKLNWKLDQDGVTADHPRFLCLKL